MNEQDAFAGMLMAGLDWAAEHIRAALEEPLGSQCVTTFASVLDYGLGNGQLPFAELAEDDADEPITPADVGLRLIHGVIALIRTKQEGAPNPNVDRILAGLERAAAAA